MQASLPREKWRGFFLKIYFRRNCFRDNNFVPTAIFPTSIIVPATIFSIFFKPLKNREAS